MLTLSSTPAPHLPHSSGYPFPAPRTLPAPVPAPSLPSYMHPYSTTAALQLTLPPSSSRRPSLATTSLYPSSPSSLPVPNSATSTTSSAPASRDLAALRRARSIATPYARTSPPGTSLSTSDGEASASSHASASSTNSMSVHYAPPPPDGGEFALYHAYPQQQVLGGMDRMSLNGHASHPHMHQHPHQQQHIPITYVPAPSDQTLEQLAEAVRNATTTSASDRAKQTFVQTWLGTNYAPYPDGNVPRQGLYMSYRRVCDEHGIPHINTATLGKAIRLCFPNIKTRRLGVRGNSKYHYCGIRPTNQTEAEWLQRYATTNQGWNIASLPATATGVRPTSAQMAHYAHAAQSEEEEEGDESDEGSAEPGHPQNLSLKPHGHPHFAMTDDRTPTTSAHLAAAQAAALPKQSPSPVPLGRAHTSVRQIPSFPSIISAIGPPPGPGDPPESEQSHAARQVWEWFTDHEDQLLDAIRNLRFDQFELGLRSFWSQLDEQHREVVHLPQVAALMARADALVYDEILETLRSQILAPIPPTALQQLRTMVDNLENILIDSLEGYRRTFNEPKIELGARFGHLVSRFLDMFQVAQALRSVLANPKQLQDMRQAWRLIDFPSVRNQTALVCNCIQDTLIGLLEEDFPALLEVMQLSHEPVREVMTWAEATYERLISGTYAEGATPRNVLIRWGFVTGQIMRDLTIRSDPAFGAFQILKLFLDDWVALHVLRAVALSTNSVAECIDNQQFMNMDDTMGAGPMSAGMGAGGADMFGNDYGLPYPSGPSQPAPPPTSGSMMAALTADNGYAPDPLDPSSAGPFSFPLGGLDFSGDVNGGAGAHQDLMSAISMSSTGPGGYPDFPTPAGQGFDDVDFSHDFNMTGTEQQQPMATPQASGIGESEQVTDSPHSHHT